MDKERDISLKYIAKSAWTEEQTAPKIKAGCDGIEYQILNPGTDPFLKPDYWNEGLAGSAVSVHMPLKTVVLPDGRKRSEDCGAGTKDFRLYFPIVCERADRIALYTGRKIHIIIHLENEESKLKDFGLWNDLVLYMRWYADRYPDLLFSIENVTKLVDEPLSNVSLVHDIDRANVGTCLDTCHAMITAYKTRMIRSERTRQVTVEDFFRLNADCINWIHLNNADDSPDGYGYGRGHGTPFRKDSPSDMQKLSVIIKYISMYCGRMKDEGGSIPVCIEVSESGYTQPPENYIKTKDALLFLTREDA